jgi:hypothetical protein
VSLSSLCTESVTIERQSIAAASTTNAGMHSSTFTADASAVLMSRPQQPSGGTPMEAMRRNLVVTHTFYTTTNPALATGDRLSYGGLKYLVQWTSDEGGRGRVYAIHTIQQAA